MLLGKKILLGVTGSIAAYKAIDILRKLREQRADVRVVMTKNAVRFVSRLTFESLSGRPVLCDDFRTGGQSDIGHISITNDLDLALIAPATANVIGKTAAGIADDALTSAVLATACQLVMAPAMNDRMYQNAIVQKNISFLREQGVTIIEPECGLLACGSSGLGRLADPDRIIHELIQLMSPRDLTGRTVLVTAGPTREPIDAVRFLTNPSTGKMGFALAAEARRRGANVILITGPVQITAPPGVRIIPVVTAEEMRQAVLSQVENAHIVIMAAAVSDFKAVDISSRKIKKTAASLSLRLEPTDDILMEIGRRSGKRVLVGFSAETDDVVWNASRKLKDKNLDLIVVNDILKQGAGFGSDTNAVIILDKTGNETDISLRSKAEIASKVLDKIVEVSANKGFLP